MFLNLAFLISLLSQVLCQDKITFPSSNRITPRYEVNEYDGNSISTAGLPQRPNFNRPYGGVNYSRPPGYFPSPVGHFTPSPGYGNNHGYEQDHQNVGDFDKCSCTESFNCRGLSYGSCDTGKRYCCYNLSGRPHNFDHISGPSNLPYNEQSHQGFNRPNYPGVLVGPGGPTGNIGRPSGFAGGGHSGNLFGPGRPTGLIGRPGHGAGGRPDVLVGPGGPTGIIGRPGYEVGGRPDVLVGPGGPTDIIGRPGQGGGGHPGVLVGPSGPTGIIGRPQGSGLFRPGVLFGPVSPRNLNDRRQDDYPAISDASPNCPEGKRYYEDTKRCE